MNKLMDFLSYASLISYRFKKEYIPTLKEEKDKLQKLRKNDLIREMQQMLELYQAYQLEYDYFDHKNQTTFSYFIVRYLHIITKYRKNLRPKPKILKIDSLR